MSTDSPIQAAAGKIGAVLVQIAYQHFGHGHLTEPDSLALGHIMYLFAGFMLIVAVIAWLYIPDVQLSGSRDKANTCIPSYWVENQTLEILGDGRDKIAVVEDRVGFKERFGALRKRISSRFRK